MKTRYTKEQKEAIESLRCNLNELENKPRRLYASIRKFAEAFYNKERRNQYLKVIATIDQAEQNFYSRYVVERTALGSSTSVKFKAQYLTSEAMRQGFMEEQGATEEKWWAYQRGVQDMENFAIKAILHETFEDALGYDYLNN